MDKQSYNHRDMVLTEKKNSGPCVEVGVNRVSVRRTPFAIPQGSGVGCNTTSPFAGGRYCISN